MKKKVGKYPLKTTEDGRTLTTFYYCPVKSSFQFTEKHIFKIVIYPFNTSKSDANYVTSFELYDGFIAFIDFEAMKAGKLAIWLWLLSCPYNKHTLVDLPSSVVKTEKRM